MAIQGTLTTMSVSDLLQFLAVGRKTGTLKFSHHKVLKGIYFENGVIVGSTTNDPKEYLGQVLIHYGKLTEAQLQVAMETQRKGDAGRLGQILVAQGVLKESEVAGVLKIRTLDIIYDLFIWKEAHFEFVVGEPLPADFTRVEVEPTLVIMEGIYRADELMRYRTLIPSDRTVMELGSGWTSSLSVGKDIRQILYFVEKRMSVAEICYNMHASSFDVYAQLYDLVNKGLAVVAGELPEIPDPISEMPNLPEGASELLLLARTELTNNNAERALSVIHTVLRREPKNSAAQTLMLEAESKYMRQVYSRLSPTAVPRLLVNPEDLSHKELGPQEGFVLSRINGEWDIQSILSICPFREADSLRMIKMLLDDGIIGL
ncbi:MAG TPA: DUF4388 domain-containing protein [Pyrinomonadaceae bacterium]|nr:DUF4388 domain-containing protein [Pyrinomonadaceae bacterium]